LSAFLPASSQAQDQHYAGETRSELKGQLGKTLTHPKEETMENFLVKAKRFLFDGEGAGMKASVE
jgi:hypothetical protein